MVRGGKMDKFDVAVWVEENSGIKVEIVGGIPVWEAFPAARHQSHIFRIQSSIRSVMADGGDCGCVHYADVYVRFPDGSLKRPDISIFCREPSEQSSAITMLPEAVVEVISPDYEGKDLQVGVPFYIRMGIKDILVLDPETNKVSHFRPGKSVSEYQSPVTLTLECGCQITT
jgi:Uma2 family endonuclease